MDESRSRNIFVIYIPDTLALEVDQSDAILLKFDNCNISIIYQTHSFSKIRIITIELISITIEMEDGIRSC
jgi:hypothetical protein